MNGLCVETDTTVLCDRIGRSSRFPAHRQSFSACAPSNNRRHCQSSESRGFSPTTQPTLSLYKHSKDDARALRVQTARFCLHQADVALLNQVEELQAAVRIFLGDRDDESRTVPWLSCVVTWNAVG